MFAVRSRLPRLVAATSFLVAGTASAWDPIGDITHPDRIINNAARETNRAVNSAGPAAPFLATPLTTPLNQINGCVQDLMSCPQQTLNQVPPGQLIQACVNNPVRCPESIAKMAPAQTVAPIIFNYKRGLLTQASGRWQALSSDFVSDFSRYYPEIDLHQIRFATNINTIHGAAITFGNRIFFPSGLDLNGQSGQRWILHELQHSVQYALKGGEQQFLSEYMLHAAGRILACGCVEVHDDISLERDAIAKANYVFQDFGWGFFVTNSCDKPINLAVHYRRTDDQWETRYWWSFGPNESAFLASSDVRLHSRNRIFYFYAYAPETNIQWAGNDPNAAWEVGNAGERPFMRRDYDSDAENFGLHITCNN